tara:strand:- start:204 stop:551 length:348 start_codon:yes stop_codon:yes gene_type:complete
MKLFFICTISLLLINSVSFNQISALENKINQNNSSINIANKYAEIYCNAKADNFFEGLENEKELKYSYFKYVGLQGKEVYSKKMLKTLINQIRENCYLSISEENEIKEFYLNASN